MNSISTILRKIITLSTVITRCRNWPELLLAKASIRQSGSPTEVCLRNGLRLRSLGSLKTCWGEIFEPAIADVYGIRKVNAPDIIIDIGANIGSFSCFAAYCHPRAKIHAFEPSHRHGNVLLENAKRNNIENISLHRAPVTADGRAVVFSEMGDGASSGLYLEGTNAVTLNSVTLAPLLFDLSTSKSAFFKLDCEGAEGEVLPWICDHARELPDRVNVACEYHHWAPIKLPHLIGRLKQSGFKTSAPVIFGAQYLFAHRSGENC